VLHKCAENSLGISEALDFVLAFYMVHELPDQTGFFAEVHAHLHPGGQLLVVEPPFHVSKAAFAETVNRARGAGFEVVDEPRVLLSKTALLRRGDVHPGAVRDQL